MPSFETRSSSQRSSTFGVSTMSDESKVVAGTWSAVANVLEECPFGPGGEEIRSGTKHFKGGAKVYVIDAYWGQCRSVTVIGQHRKGRRFIKVDMEARHLTDFRPKPVYHPSVVKLIAEHFSTQKTYPDKEYAEKLAAGVQAWFK